MEVETLQVALCGIGGYGAGYVCELLDNGASHGAALAAVVDPSPERCDLIGEIRARGVPVFASLEELYAQLTPDLVVVSTPIHLHAQQSITALRHGSAVLCEKPVAATIQDARAMAAAALEAGKILAVGYQWSFSPAIQTLKRDILEGRFGRPLRLKTLVLTPRPASYYGRCPWAGKIKTAKGEWVLDSPAHNATAHFLHNMLYLLGEKTDASAMPLSVQAELYRANDIENYDTAALRCVLPGGVELLFYTTHAVSGQVGPVMRYEFEKATLHYQHQAGDVFHARTKSGEEILYGNPDDQPMGKLWSVVAAARGGTPPLCGVEAASVQTLCVNAAQEAGIGVFPREFVQAEPTARGDTQVWVPGLGSVLVQCYSENLLPSELGHVPWARSSTPVELASYPM